MLESNNEDGKCGYPGHEIQWPPLRKAISNSQTDKGSYRDSRAQLICQESRHASDTRTAS